MQSINRCLTEYGVWHPTHHGGCSCLSRYEWVISVCPIHRRDRIISSLRDFLYPSFHCPISAFVVWSLLCGMLFHLNCHLFWVKIFISIFKSVHGILWTPTHGRAKAGRPARTYIQQLCEDTGCCPEDQPEAMNDREKWRERVRDIRATSMT